MLLLWTGAAVFLTGTEATERLRGLLLALVVAHDTLVAGVSQQQLRDSDLLQQRHPPAALGALACCIAHGTCLHGRAPMKMKPQALSCCRKQPLASVFRNLCARQCRGRS